MRTQWLTPSFGRCFRSVCSDGQLTRKKNGCVPILLIALIMPWVAVADLGIEVEDAWVQESSPKVTDSAAYMTLNNAGDQTDRLLGASSDATESIELRNQIMDGYATKIQQVEAIEVNPGEATVLKPGGAHLMLIGLKLPLTEGQRLLLTLHFERTGDVPVEVTIKK